MPNILDTPLRIKHGPLRVFADAEEAKAYTDAHPQSNKIWTVAGNVANLHWRIFRRLSERRVQRLRRYLNSARCGGCAFFCGPHGGFAWSFEVPESKPLRSIPGAVTESPKVIASTICRMTGARP